MEDKDIVNLYWLRDEKAIDETAKKYEKYLHSISYRILFDAEDAKECVNDTYGAAWNSMPPHKPDILSTFLGKITRRISIDLCRKSNAKKRGSGEVLIALDELEECVAGKSDVEINVENQELQKIISVFLSELPTVKRQVFLRRYWYLDSISDIAGKFGFSENKVMSMLHRIRKKLREVLVKEGYDEIR